MLRLSRQLVTRTSVRRLLPPKSRHALRSLHVTRLCLADPHAEQKFRFSKIRARLRPGLSPQELMSLVGELEDVAPSPSHMDAVYAEIEETYPDMDRQKLTYLLDGGYDPTDFDYPEAASTFLMKLEEPHVQDALQSLDEDKQFQLLDLKAALPYDDFSDLGPFHDIVDFLRENEIDVDFSNLPEVLYERELTAQPIPNLPKDLSSGYEDALQRVDSLSLPRPEEPPSLSPIASSSTEPIVEPSFSEDLPPPVELFVPPAQEVEVVPDLPSDLRPSQSAIQDSTQTLEELPSSADPLLPESSLSELVLAVPPTLESSTPESDLPQSETLLPPPAATDSVLESSQILPSESLQPSDPTEQVSPLPQDADPAPVSLDPAEEHQQYVKAFFDKFDEPSVDKAIDQFDHDTRTDLLSLITNASETNFADPKWFPAIVDFLSQHGISLDVSDLPEHFYKKPKAPKRGTYLKGLGSFAPSRASFQQTVKWTPEQAAFVHDFFVKLSQPAVQTAMKGLKSDQKAEFGKILSQMDSEGAANEMVLPFALSFLAERNINVETGDTLLPDEDPNQEEIPPGHHWPNLMTPDPLMDSRDVVDFPPTKDNPFHNRVIVRNHKSMFHELMEENKFDFDDPTAQPVQTDLGRSAPEIYERTGISKRFKLRDPSIHLYRISRRVIQQTACRSSPIIGNGNGLVGLGRGTHADMSLATIKSYSQAIKNMDYVDRFEDRTVWTEVESKFGSTRILMRPRPLGFGLRCGPTLHRLFKAAGIKDISAKVWKSRNPILILQGALRMLQSGHNPLGMGDGAGGPGRRMQKGAGIRSYDSVTRARGRSLAGLTL
ncbi:hypothetical protein IW261DRAFT_1466752 [Armillaria novae-zelandiae]|uniref:Ribosomal protein S5 C-terminal domain-containing protein n=1 Tax=Armillaria novae-zelandiae TaxID=153914 RepID=A0AA39UAK0_9AGAR|nr:hypothetical protein IW261DRAFT_1466752 [Armillaria novae-zelandiae]